MSNFSFSKFTSKITPLHSSSSSSVHFLSFGAGKEFKKSLAQIEKEALQFSFFDYVHACNEDLLVEDNDFWNQHGKFIVNNPRGYGYWLWKPYIVLRLLDKIKENDIIVYADAGCQLNSSTIEAKERMNEYVEIARKSPHGILSFALKHPDLIDARYTKMDTAVALDIPPLGDFMYSKQLVGGIFVVRKCPYVMELFRSFLFACTMDNYHNITDCPSHLTNLPEFKEHRHDQSVFSLLRKKRGTEILKDETFFWREGSSWETNGANFPIWARRRRY